MTRFIKNPRSQSALSTSCSLQLPSSWSSWPWWPSATLQSPSALTETSPIRQHLQVHRCAEITSIYCIERRVVAWKSEFSVILWQLWDVTHFESNTIHFMWLFLVWDLVPLSLACAENSHGLLELWEQLGRERRLVNCKKTSRERFLAPQHPHRSCSFIYLVLGSLSLSLWEHAEINSVKNINVRFRYRIISCYLGCVQIWHLVFLCLYFQDEGALVRAARNLGFVFSGRTPDSVIVETVSLSLLTVSWKQTIVFRTVRWD